MEWNTNCLIAKNYSWQDYNTNEKELLNSTLSDIDIIAHRIGLAMLFSCNLNGHMDQIYNNLQTKFNSIQNETNDEGIIDKSIIGETHHLEAQLNEYV